MKIRLTLGSIVGLVTTTAGAIAAHDQIINLVANTFGGKVFVVGTAVLAIAKGIVSWNHQQIPETKKMEAGPVIFEKTGLANL